MVFSFFKKPPEKMVARPAATPRPLPQDAPGAGAGHSTPASASVPASDSVPPAGKTPAPSAAPLESLDFTSGFSGFSETPGEIRLDSDIDPIEAEVEQAAVLYANAQDELARTMLEGAIRMHPYGPGERFWLMLFDLYRLTDQRAAFDAMSLEYARTFEKSPPAWGAAHGGRPAPSGPAAMAGVAAGSVLFRGELAGDNQAAFALLDQAVNMHSTLCVDLGKVSAIDAPGAERMLGILTKARRERHEIVLDGCEALVGLIEAQIERGRREAAACWLLLLELYQLLGRHETFEERAIDYAVTFEMSPPSWESPRAVAAALPASVPAMVDRSPAHVYVLQGELKAERFADLPEFGERTDPLVIDFSAVTRIDFISAGTLVNLLSKFRNQGKHVLVRHPNHMVAELLGVVGLRSVADIEYAKV